MADRKLPPALSKNTNAAKRKDISKSTKTKKTKSSASKKHKSNSGEATAKASKPASTSTRVYALYSVRRKRHITPFVARSKKNTVVLVPPTKYYPRMDGGDFEDYNRGELIYLVAKEEGSEAEKRIANCDLGLFNIRRDPDWDVEHDDEGIAWEKLNDEDDYEPAVDSLPEFLKKVEGDRAKLVDERWTVYLHINRKNQSVYIEKVKIALPSSS